MPDKIFISYRRDDVPGDARGIRDALTKAFGRNAVFMDVDNLLIGLRFDEELAKALDECSLLIAVIGPRWLDLLKAKTAAGERDFVRDEIAAALTRRIKVIPVRVGGEGRMPPLPAPADLPDDIRDLVLYQKQDVSHEHFGRDMADFVAGLRQLRNRDKKPLSWPLLASSGLAALLLAYASGAFVMHWPPFATVPDGGTGTHTKQVDQPISPPPRGEGGGVGGTVAAGSGTIIPSPLSPHPGPPRQGEGGRGDAADAAAAATAAAQKAEEDRRKADAAAKAQRQADAAAAAKAGREADARAAFAAVRDSRDATVIEAFIDRYGDTVHGDAARKLLADVQAAEARRKADEEAARRQAEAERQRLADETRPGREFDDCSKAGWCPKMVVVPAKPDGFMMGSNDGDSDEKPVHRVTIAAPFAVGKFEVTWDEWEACVAGGGCDNGPVKAAGGDQGWGKGSRPAINVSWNDAKAYVKWLSKKTGEAYRLLSEAEWEYAARAATTTQYSTGDTITKTQAQFSEGNWGSAGKTVEVGQFPANQFGLYDVHGNVWEWVEDCYHDSYKGAPADGSAVTTGSCGHRVLRGGSWDYYPSSLRSAYRGRNAPDLRSSSLGFRVARSLSSPRTR
jgi:formylglycine-generating enzyme required for sulfatase activity